MRPFYAILLVCVASGAVQADVVLTRSFDERQVRVFDAGRGAEYHYGSSAPDGEPGTPAFARERFVLLLPPDEAPLGATVVASDWRMISDQAPAPTRRHRPITDLSPVELEYYSTPPEPDPVAFSSSFPTEQARVVAWGDMDGARVAVVEACPFRWNPDRGVVEFAAEMEVVVRTEPAGRPREPLRRIAYAAHARDQALAEMVRNPLDVHRWAATTAVETEPHAIGSRLRDDLPSIESLPVGFIVVGPDSFASAAAPLVDWRTRCGVPSAFVPVSVALTNYPGCDPAERLRNFLKDAYSLWGTTHVLLLGADNVIPVRQGSAPYPSNGQLVEIPTDLYYACLDGSWNSDGDLMWGESPQDDKFPEIAVVRIPVRDAESAADVVVKVLRYQLSPVAANAARATFTAEYSAPGVPTPIEVCNTVFVPLVPDDVALTLLYSDHETYGGDAELNRASLLDALDGSEGLVVHYGHGSQYVLGASYVLTGEVIGRSDADALRYSPLEPTSGPFPMFTVSCNSNAFDEDCIAEHLIVNPDGGPVSVYGHAAPVLDVQYQGVAEFLRRLLADGVDEFGENLKATLAYLSFDSYLQMSTAPFGDPTMRIFIGVPRRVVVDRQPELLDVSTGLVRVSVSSAGGPVEGATVCVSGPGDDYAVAATGADGVADVITTFTDTGRAVVAVSGYEIIACVDTVAVGSIAGSRLVVEGAIVDDPPPDGDGDGVLDAGETASLSFLVYNAGTEPSSPQVAVFRSTYLKVSDSTLLVPSVPAFGTVATGADVVVDASRGTPDSSIATGEVVVQTIEPASLVELCVRAPALSICGVAYDDGGDGAPNFGDTALVALTVQNDGGDDSRDVLARLIPSALAEVLEDSAGSAVIPSRGSAVLSPPFVAAPTSSYYGGALPMELEVRDRRGLVDTLTFELWLPPAPTGLEFTSDASSITLAWDQSPDSTVVGYRVFRSDSAGGFYAPVSGEPWGLTPMYVEFGLAPRTTFYYRVAAVASGGRQSALSDSIDAWTSLAYSTGWPIQQSERIEAAPLVCDMDSDGDLEIVSASRMGDLYAFHHDGSEVIDRLPATLDPFFSTPGANQPGAHGIWAAPAAADLDGDGAVEITVIAWINSTGIDSLYVLRPDGTVAPGWPQPQVGGAFSSLHVADLEGDGQLEIFHQCCLKPWVYGWRADGTEVRDGDGDPTTVGVFGVLAGEPSGGNFYVAPTVADLDGDGSKEVVCGGNYSTTAYKVHVLNADGTERPGFPVALPTGRMDPSIAIGDVDGDTTTLEVVVGAIMPPGVSDPRVFAIRHDGTIVLDWWVLYNDYGVSGVSLGDVDDDGEAELVFQSATSVIALERDGSFVPGWPVPKEAVIGHMQTPVIADIDGDGHAEVIVGARNGTTHYGSVGAYSVVGDTARILPGWPIAADDGAYTSPVVADLDGDGDLELVVGWYNGTLAVYETGSRHVAGADQWTMYRRDAARSDLRGEVGVQTIPVVVLRRDLDSDGVPDLLGAGVSVRGVVSSPPFDSSATFVFLSDQSGGVAVVDSTFNPWSYGDSLRLWGAVGQDDGATVLRVETTDQLGTGVVPPAIPTTLSGLADTLAELREGDIVALSSLSLVGTWPVPGFDGELLVVSGADTMALFVDRDTDLDDGPPPQEPFDLAAFVWQRDSTPPYTAGHTLLPRWRADFTSVGAPEEPSLPTSYSVGAPYPNPFNPTVALRLDLPRDSRVRVEVYNILGQRVTTVVDETMRAGYRRVEWDAGGFASGVYFVRVSAGEWTETKKAVLLK